MAPPSHTPRGTATAASRAAWARGRTLALGLAGALAACRESPATTLNDATVDVLQAADLATDRDPPIDAMDVSVGDLVDVPIDVPGDRSSLDASAFADVTYADGPVRVTRIFAGSGYGFALSVDGELWGWGSNEDGTFAPVDESVRFRDYRTRPQRIDGISHVREMQLRGGSGICALTESPSDGRVYCWGYGAFHFYGEELGIPFTAWLAPRPMGTIVDVLRLGQGGIVTRSDHTFWFFGATNEEWRTDPRFLAPAIQRIEPNVYWVAAGFYAPESLPGFSHDILQVDGVVNAVGDTDHVCMLLNTGHVRCWGINHYAQGGVPTRDSEVCQFISSVSGTLVSQLCLSHPTEVPGIDDAIKIATGLGSTCVIRRGGSVWCWGWDYALDDGLGVIGDGRAPDEQCVPAFLVFGERRKHPEDAIPCRQHPTRVVGIDDAVEISVGTDHSCVVRSSGAVWCWGDNHRGQLGDGTRISHGTPVPVRWY